MKIVIFLIILLILPLKMTLAASGSSCSEGNICNVEQINSEKNGVEICKDSKGVTRRKATYKDNVLNGLWECFNEKSELIESRNYKNDKLNGLTKRLKSEINRFEEINYADDELDGRMQVYQTSTENGKTTLTGSVVTQYKKGNEHGFQIFYDQDGKEKKRICFQDSRMKEENPELCGGVAILKKEETKKEDPYKGWKTTYFASKKIQEKYLLVGLTIMKNTNHFLKMEKWQTNLNAYLKVI